MSYLLSILAPRPASRVLALAAIIVAGRSPALAAVLALLAYILGQAEAAQ